VAIAVLVNPTGPSAEPLVSNLQAAARTLGLQLQVLNASTDNEIEWAFASLRAGGLVVGGDPLFNSRSALIAAPSLRHAAPTIFQYREFAAAGGLMSYGGSISDQYHRSASTPVASSRARSHPTCRCSNPARSS
jgi:putative ABC transport system substrate-binding protein